MKFLSNNGSTIEESSCIGSSTIEILSHVCTRKYISTNKPNCRASQRNQKIAAQNHRKCRKSADSSVKDNSVAPDMA
jgi:hypothetical protein